MTHYIDKDAVVSQANIEITNCCLAAQKGILTEFGKGKLEGLEGIVDFLNTLEVKEVDLEKEYKDFVEEDPVYNKLVNGIVGKAIAKHFFVLGLKAQKEIDYEN